MPTTKHRLTVNLSDGEFGELAALAEQHKASVAWLGRMAITDFLERNRAAAIQLPLTFAARPQGE